MEKVRDKVAANGIVTDETPQNDTAAIECPVQQGYTLSWLKCLVFYPLATFPLGIGLLLSYWFPVYWVKLTCMVCSLKDAMFVIVKDKNGKNCVESVKKVFIPLEGSDSAKEEAVAMDINDTEDESEEVHLLLSEQKLELKYFVHCHLRYVYREDRQLFVLLKGYDNILSCTEIYEKLSNGLTSQQHRDKSLQYGPNLIDVPVKPYHVLFFKEVLHPFYIFQVFAVAVWCSTEYYYYSAAVVVISAVSVLVSLVQTRKYMEQLHDMMKTSCKVNVMRNGQVVEGVPSETLAPGDVLVVPPSGMDVPCDAVLLSGQAIVNEAMLTGESVPVTKTPLPQDCNKYCPEKYKRHTLFCGTRVIQTRFYSNSAVTAVVVRTGFSTAKGSIVRSILFPKPINIKFYADAIKFILILSVIAFFGFVYTIVYLQVKRFSVFKTVIRALDVITTAVPPALPAALTVGTVYAVKRLRKQNIFCISPRRIDLCGKVKLVCFDKTGTLTEDSMDVMGVKPVQNGRFSLDLENASNLPVSSRLLQGMASGHSLTTIDGELTGDPLDVKMFQATDWTFEEPSVRDNDRFDMAAPAIVRPPKGNLDDDQFEIGILKQFPFSSELQRMSVITRKLPGTGSNILDVFVKGAPETIEKLCIPSTVPGNFAQELALLTQQGYRVLALAHKSIHMQWHKTERAKRHAMECDLEFDGLLVMQNKLKEKTTPVIHSLIRAAIRPVMITGDNLLTAVSVSRKCEMVPASSMVIEVKVTVVGNAGPPSVTYQLIGERAPTDMDCMGHTSVNLEDANGSLPFYQYNCFADRSYHLAITGKSFALVCEHYPELLEKILVKGTVFARMSPDQKAQLVTALMSIGYGVAMCGDGANDCGALKAAHAGISLSETEASVASPFTSRTPDITCIPKLIREGRASLVTSFSVFKFMALYSLTEFIAVSILYAYESNLGDMQYLFVDLILIFSIIFVMGLTGPYPELVKKRPPGTLAGVHVILSIIVQVILVIIFQVGPLLYLKIQPWYVPLVPSAESDNILSSENSVIFQVSNFQYISIAVALSTAAPFRKPIYTNYAFLVCLAILFPICIYFTLAPASWWPWFWQRIQIVPHPCITFSITLVEMALFHCVIAFIFERFIFPSEWMHKLLRIVRCKRRPRNRYKHILAAIPTNWPSPIQQ